MAHAHTPSETTDRGNEKRLLQAFIVTAGFMLVEAIGGVVSGSLALLADAGHCYSLYSRSASPAVLPTPATRSAGCA